MGESESLLNKESLLNQKAQNFPCFQLKLSLSLSLHQLGREKLQDKGVFRQRIPLSDVRTLYTILVAL